MKCTKRLQAPKTWNIKKNKKFIISMNPGPHPKKRSVPLLVLLRDTLMLAKTAREAKKILNNKEILIDTAPRKEARFPVGLFDTVSIPKIKKHFRIVLNQKGKIKLIEITEEKTKVKVCKIVGKTAIKGENIALRLHDGRTIRIAKKDDRYKTKDSLIISLPKQEIKRHIKCERKVTVFIIAGKHVGETATIEKFHSFKGPQVDRVLLKGEKGEEYETLEDHIFIIGEKRPLIKIR